MLLLVACPAVSAAAEVVRAELGEDTAWTGEAVPLLVTLYSPGPFSGTPAFDLPELPLTVFVKSGNPLVGTEQVDGESYFTQRHEFALYTQCVGEIVVPAFRVRFAGKKTFTSAPEPRPATRADEPYDKLKSSMCSRPRSFSVRCHRMDKLTATTRKETGMASPQSQELARRAGVIDWFGHHPLSWDLTFRVAEAVGLSAGRAETARRVRAVGSSPCRTRAKASASGRPDHGGSLAWMPKTRRDRTAHSRCRSSPRADCNSLSRFAPPSGADTARFQSISAA